MQNCYDVHGAEQENNNEPTSNNLPE